MCRDHLNIPFLVMMFIFLIGSVSGIPVVYNPYKCWWCKQKGKQGGHFWHQYPVWHQALWRGFFSLGSMKRLLFIFLPKLEWLPTSASKVLKKRHPQATCGRIFWRPRSAELGLNKSRVPLQIFCLTLRATECFSTCMSMT